MKAVHFGAGNIGRGFVAEFLHNSGYEVVFCDVMDNIIDQLQTSKSYKVIQVGAEDTKESTITNYRAINSKTHEADVIKEITTANVETCSGGPRILKIIVPIITKGINSRPNYTHDAEKQQRPVDNNEDLGEYGNLVKYISNYRDGRRGLTSGASVYDDMLTKNLYLLGEKGTGGSDGVFETLGDAGERLGVSDPESRNRRRGRGPRQVIGLNGSDDPSDHEFFTRDFEFRSKEGSPNLARCRLDSQCEIPLLVSMRWTEENGKTKQISHDFKDPGMMSVSGHAIQADGILRNMVFNLKGSTVTFRRDVLVCSQLDEWTDMVAGAKFIAKEFAILFSKAKKMFAGIFGFKKVSPDETILKQQLQYQAYLEFQESERLRRERQAREQREREEARRRRREAEAHMAQMAQNGQGTGHH